MWFSLSLSPSLHTRLLSVPHSERNIITCSPAPLLLSCFPCCRCCQSEGLLSLSLPSLCIFSHLLSFAMSSWGEMGEAIELRWVRNRVGDVFEPREGTNAWHPAHTRVFALRGICAYISHFFLCNCAPGCILDSNWVNCSCSNQHLGLFFLSLTSFSVRRFDPDPAL